MGLSTSRKGNINSLSQTDIRNNKKVNGYVYDVILDETHDLVKGSNRESALIGAIQFRTIDDNILAESDLPIAYPLEKGFKSVPVKNELVEIYEFSRGLYGYRRIGPELNPSKGLLKNRIDKNFKPIADSESNSSNYRKVQKTNISRGKDTESQGADFGKYYEPQDGIHKLKLYEGDTLIESRFGQSIRFSAFNNTNNDFSPTTIIRNSENTLTRQVVEYLPIEEDLNRDGSVISMSSNTYQLNFKPGVLDDKGNSNFETRPESFSDYPSKLIGDQILINSGRIIFSAKSAEMIFYSKKNYGFISDGGLSIDNKLGIDISVGDQINVVSNDNDVYFYTGQGSIFLGNTDLEPLVKGNTLAQLLADIVDIFYEAQFYTPTGPTPPGPVKKALLNSIKTRIPDILSNLNQTS